MTFNFRYLLTFTLLLILVSVNAASTEIEILEIPTASEITVELAVSEIVNEGEMISFSYELSSNKETTVSFIPHIKCNSGPGDFLNEETATITPSEPYSGAHTFVKVNYKEFENGMCVAYIYILEPEEETFSETFEIKVADYLHAETDTYAPDETGNKRVFLVGETAEVRSEATTNTYAEAAITYTTTVSNNGSIVGTFTGKTFTLLLSETGYYEVRVIASANSFMLDEAVTRFTVVKEHAIPTSVNTICNYNMTCEPNSGENSGNCVMDCPLAQPVISEDPFTKDLTPEPKPAPVIPTTRKTTSIGAVLGSAMCIFDDACTSVLNFGIIAAAIAIIIGIMFLKIRKNKGALK
ncbi:MAG: hypothetical protein V1672_01920 [Candidatus Diapherotrites archaeon]